MTSLAATVHRIGVASSGQQRARRGGSSWRELMVGPEPLWWRMLRWGQRDGTSRGA